jgi:Tol biopolymer transport system component
MNYFKFYLFAILILFTLSCTKNFRNEKSNTNLKGDYLGQLLPKDSAEIFAENFISNEFNERDMTISPNGNELFYSLKGSSNFAIICVKRINGIWQSPEVASFSGKYSDIEPCFSNDGKRLYFVSNRPLIENGEEKDFDIWFAEKSNDNWGIPQNLGEPVNTEANEFYPSFTNDGTIYFCAARKDSYGSEDLFYSEFKDGKYQDPKNLGDSINTTKDEFNAFVEPNGKFIMFTSTGWGKGFGGGDLWISFRKEDRSWATPINMGEKVNSPFFEYCPSLTPDGKYLFFTSNRTTTENNVKEKLTYNKILKDLHSTLNGSQNIYWISTDFINNLKK